MSEQLDGASNQHVGQGTGAGRGIEAEDAFVLDGVEFVPSWSRPSSDGSLTLLKSPRMVDVYATLFESCERPRIVELGISQGGSVALFSLMARPTSLVAIELSPDRIGPLDLFIAERGLGDVVRPHYGVDQSDTATLRQLVLDANGDERLDLVIDDASHRYHPTVASFECLFPRLRPGGRYVIEDWTTMDVLGIAIQRHLATAPPESRDALVAQMAASGPAEPETPMSLIAVELLLARAQATGGVAAVAVDEDWIVVTRDDAPLDPDTYRLADAYEDHLGILARRAPG